MQRKKKTKILILTSNKTGSGHRSSANAIEKKLKSKGFETRQLNVFPLMGRTGLLMENSYIPLTTRAPFVYYLCQRFSELFPWLIHIEMYYRVRKNLMKVIREFRPDLIISVHCMFTGAISHLIKREGLSIPFHVGVIDLIDPPKVWEDRNADMTFVPTQEIRDDYVSRGFQPDRVLVSGFPVRDDIIARDRIKKIGKKINILMVNTSTDLKKNIRFLDEVSKLKDVQIDFVCGLDERMHQVLVQKMEDGEIRKNVRIHGFITNVNELLEKSHILLTKAGPNMIMEALHSGTAIIITGHIKGQESKNFRYVTENGFGLKCEDPGLIGDVLHSFIDGGDLVRCLKNITDSKLSNGAETIADYEESIFRKASSLRSERAV